MHPRDADPFANIEDPDQTAPLGVILSGSAQWNSLIRVCTVCSDLAVLI